MLTPTFRVNRSDLPLVFSWGQYATEVIQFCKSILPLILIIYTNDEWDWQLNTILCWQPIYTTILKSSVYSYSRLETVLPLVLHSDSLFTWQNHRDRKGIWIFLEVTSGKTTNLSLKTKDWVTIGRKLAKVCSLVIQLSLVLTYLMYSGAGAYVTMNKTSLVSAWFSEEVRMHVMYMWCYEQLAEISFTIEIAIGLLSVASISRWMDAIYILWTSMIEPSGSRFSVINWYLQTLPVVIWAGRTCVRTS
jgi:hypothetical protein